MTMIVRSAEPVSSRSSRVRLGVVLAALTPVGLLAYLVAWAALPEEDPSLGRTAGPGSRWRSVPAPWW
ncbi:MAG: hypothetical protein ACRDV9_01115 [Acidimicrobiia bacterium]